jgi:hypothetical protein
MRRARESLASQPPALKPSEETEEEPRIDREPDPPAVLDEVKPKVSDPEDDDDRYQRVQVMSPIGARGLYGNQETRRRQMVMWGLGRVVDATLRKVEGSMTVDQMLADRFFREYAKAERRSRTLWGIDLTAEKVTAACDELVDTGWAIAIEASPPSWAAVWPKPHIGAREAFDEVLVLIGQSESSETMRPKVDEVWSRIYPPRRPIDWDRLPQRAAGE